MVPSEEGGNCYRNYYSAMEHGPHNGEPTAIYFAKRLIAVNAGDTRLEPTMGNTLQLMSSLFAVL